MTMGTRVAEHTPLSPKVLLIQNGQIVLSHNHTDTGPAVPIIASLLLEHKIAHAYIAGVKLYDVLGYLNTLMQKSVPGWKMRITARRRIAHLKDGKENISGIFFVDYFCIDEEKSGKRNRNPRRRFDVINLDLLKEHPPENPEDQLQMALAILEICEHRGIKFRGTRGGLGSAMLKKSPHWVKGRYAAPRFINQIARSYLPGNFYALSDKAKKRQYKHFPHCYYIDQISSHHNVVASIDIPHPQYLHARGNWKSLTGRWANPDSQVGQSLMDGSQFGLAYCYIHCSAIGPTQKHLYPPWSQEKGGQYKWLWTPELRLIENDHRLQLDHFVAAFTASESDPVLREYAEWAIEEISCNSATSVYKKGSLLAAYGMLAFNNVGKPLFRYWGGSNKKQKCTLPVAGSVGETRIVIPEQVQLSTVNVIARGMIESETRTRSIEFARELTDSGFHVPQMYADGILVATDQLPFIPNGWRVSHSLTNVYIPRSNAIMSDQIVKLPGIMADEQSREWERIHEESHRIVPSHGRPVREDLVTIGT